jgi:hypothetical protein
MLKHSNEVKPHAFLSSTIDGGELSVTCCRCFKHFRGKSHQNSLVERLGGKWNLYTRMCGNREREREIRNAAENQTLIVWSVPKTAKFDLA